MNKPDVEGQDNFEQCCASDLWVRGYRYSAVAIILPIRDGFLFFKIFFYGKIRVEIVN